MGGGVCVGGWGVQAGRECLHEAAGKECSHFDRYSYRAGKHRGGWRHTGRQCKHAPPRRSRVSASATARTFGAAHDARVKRLVKHEGAALFRALGERSLASCRVVCVESTPQPQHTAVGARVGALVGAGVGKGQETLEDGVTHNCGPSVNHGNTRAPRVVQLRLQSGKDRWPSLAVAEPITVLQPVRGRLNRRIACRQSADQAGGR